MLHGNSLYACFVGEGLLIAIIGVVLWWQSPYRPWTPTGFSDAYLGGITEGHDNIAIGKDAMRLRPSSPDPRARSPAVQGGEG